MSTITPVTRQRGLCLVDNCTNKAYSRQLCCRHGAKKLCIVDGCTLRARRNDVCYHHGAPKSICVEAGCNQHAQARQRCVRHGGGRLCKSQGCTSHARLGGFCQRHQNIGAMAAWAGHAFEIPLEKLESDSQHARSYSMDSTDDVTVFESSAEFASAVMYYLSGDDIAPEPTDADFDAMMVEDVLAILVQGQL